MAALTAFLVVGTLPALASTAQAAGPPGLEGRIISAAARITESGVIGTLDADDSGRITAPDRTGDGVVGAGRSDLTGVTLDATTNDVTVGFAVQDAVDPHTDSHWLSGEIVSGTPIVLDGTTPDLVAVMGNDGSGHLFAGVVKQSSGAAELRCRADGRVVSPTSWQITFPTACVGSFRTIRVQGEIAGSGSAADRSPNDGPTSPVQVAPGTALAGGGVVVDGWGGLHPFSIDGQSPGPIGAAPYWPGWDIVRGLASTAGGLYELDGWGGLHGVGWGGDAGPTQAHGAPYWPGWDIARGVATLADGSGGYVLDGWGGLHPFSIGANPAPPIPTQSAYWRGWDIARGIVLLPDGSGGYVLDGWGGLHPFSIPGRATQNPPGLIGTPYWSGHDLARGMALRPDGSGGVVLDSWGGVHGFAIGDAPAPVASGVAYWPGWSIARGIAIPPLFRPAHWASAPVPGSTRLTALTGDLGAVTFGGDGSNAYVCNVDRGELDVVSVATGVLTKAIPVGLKPVDVDRSPDGSRLYVANSGSEDLSVVDAATGTELRRIPLPQAATWNEPISVAVANNGDALVATANGDLLMVNLATEQVTALVVSGGRLTDRGRLRASPDRAFIGIAEVGSSAGNVRLYSAAQDAVNDGRRMETFINDIDVSSDASQFLVDGRFLLDAAQRLRGTVDGSPTGAGGGVFSRDASIAYRPEGGRGSGWLTILDGHRFLGRGYIPLPDSLSTYDRGRMAQPSAKGDLAVTTDHGVVIVHPVGRGETPAPPPAFPSRTSLVPLGGHAEQVVTDAARRVAYVTDSLTNAVDVVDLTTRTPIAAIPVGSDPTGLDLSPDGRRLFVANSGGDNISVVDLAARTEVERIELPLAPWNDFRPVGIGAANNGKLVISAGGAGNGDLFEMDLASHQFRSLRSQTAPLAWGGARVRSSSDHALVGLVEPGPSDGRVGLYSATTGVVVNHELWHQLLDVDVRSGPGPARLVADGSVIADSSAFRLGTIDDARAYTAFNLDGSLVYRVQPTRGGPARLEILDSRRFLGRGAVTLPDTVDDGRGSLSVRTPNLVSIVTDHGLVVMAPPVPDPPPLPPLTQPSTDGLVPLIGKLSGIAIDPTNKTAFVTNTTTNTVAIIDLATRAVIGVIDVGSRPHGIDITPDGKTLYVANNGGSDVSIVDVASRSETRRIRIPPEYPSDDLPFSIAVAANGKALISTFDGRHLRELDLATDDLSTPALGFVDELVYGGAKLRASKDHTAIAFLDDLNKVALYKATSDSFVAHNMLPQDVDGSGVDTTSQGSRTLVSGADVLDGSLNSAGRVPGGGYTDSVFAADGITAYRPTTMTGPWTKLDVINTSLLTVLGTIDLPDPLPEGRNPMATTGAAGVPQVVVVTVHGVSIVDG